MEPRSKVINLRDAPAGAISGDGAREIVGLPLLELTEGTGGFDVRGVRIAPGGVSADHLHAWEQANFILSGQGTVELGTETHEVGPHDFVYVAPNVRHVFTNTGGEDLVLLATRGPRVE